MCEAQLRGLEDLDKTSRVSKSEATQHVTLHSIIQSALRLQQVGQIQQGNDGTGAWHLFEHESIQRQELAVGEELGRAARPH